MNQIAGHSDYGALSLDSGLEALQSSPEFRGPVESIDGHDCNDHFAHIYETPEEKFEAAVPFIRHGIERGDRVMYVVDESTEADVRAALRAGGVDVEEAIASGALSFHTVQETYLRTESFDVDEMIDFYGETVAAVTEEYEGLRIVAEMTWIAADDTPVEKVMEYEQRINDLFAETDSLAICQYERERFEPEVIRNVVKTHPHLIYDGAACHNVYYTPPEEFFGDDAPARENDRMLRTLRDRTESKAELADHRRFLGELYEITASQDRTFEEKLDALFELGCEQFGVGFGFLNRVDPAADHLEIEHASGEHPHYEVGSELPLSETYCEAAVDIEAAVDVADPTDEGYDDCFVYEEFGVDGYLGTYVPVAGGADRTLAFVPEESCEQEFSEQDRAHIELMGQWIGYELNRRQREEFVRECYEITSDPASGFEEKLDAMLELGCEQFALECGGLARIDPDADLFEVEHVRGDHDHLVPGEQYPLSETYCRLVAAEGETATVTDPADAGFDGKLCYEQFGVQTYLGTHLPVDGDLDRTFWFVSNEERETPITETERTFVHLMGEWVRYELERRRREQFIRDCYEITSDPASGFEEKLHRLLDLARDRMDLDAAGLTHLPEWDGAFRNEYALGYGDGVVDASDDVWTDPGEGCYCRQAIAADGPVGMADVRGTDWADDEIHREHGLRCYLGTKVTNGSTPYGTLWVGSTEPRDRPFTEAERTFLELIGQWVSYELERREHSDAQRELYEVTADPDRSFDEKLDALFELGREQFGLEVGGMAAVDREADRIEVERVGGDHEAYEAGLTFPLSETFCGSAVEADGQVCILDPAAGDDARRVYDEFGFETYLGTALDVEGDRDRVFFFMSEDARDAEFSEAERTFLDLMGQWIEYELERRQRERELRERTEHLTALVETTPECIKTIAEDGTVLQMNSAGLDVVEADAESDVVGEPVYDLIAPEDRERFREFNERICAGERGTLEFDVVGLEGTRRHMETHAAPLQRPDGTTVQVSLTRDVTEQKEREQALRESKNQLRALIEAVPVAVFVAEDDGEIVEWNEAAEEVWGGEVAVSESVAEYAEYDGWWADTGEPLEPDEWPLARALEGEVVADPDEIEIEGFDGKRRTVLNHGMPVRDADGEVSRAIVTLVDITERKKHERYQRELYDITADPDLGTGEKIDRLLEAGCERLDLPVGMLTRERGQAFEIEHMHGSHPDLDEGTLTPSATDNYCRRVVETGESLSVGDTGAAGWDGDALYDEFDLQSYAGTQVTVGGDVYGTVCFADTESREAFTEAEQAFLDLLGQCVSYELERQQHERDLEETIERLEQSNDRLKQFAYAASHDLQEPLRMVSSYLQLLEDQYRDELDETAQEYIDFAVDGADRMRAMVDDLLAYSRVEQADGAFEPVDCEAVLDRVTDDLQVRIEENGAEVDVDSLPEVLGDREQLEQLFSNLVANGVKYNESDRPRVDITAERRGDYWEFAVSDNGIGIDPEKADRIFEVFKRLHHDDEYTGTGIGLSLCQEIVDNHGGTIRVDSEPGEGSTFSFTLPAAGDCDE